MTFKTLDEFDAQFPPGFIAEADRDYWIALQGQRMFKSTRHIPTPDDWYPTLEGGLVEGSVRMFLDPYTSREREWCEGMFFVRICFWGGDDTGIERDFYCASIDSARALYNRLVKWLGAIAVVSRDDLKKLGFENA